MKQILLSISVLAMAIAISNDAFAQPAPPGSSPVITEIMYNPPEAGNDSLEFIEVLNPSLIATINMTGYHFTSGIEFTFPDGFILGQGEHVLIAGDSVIFEAFYGIEAFQWEGATTALNNSGEALTLRNGGGIIADSVDYGSGNDWPQEASGDGYSMVLCDPEVDNNLPSNWTASENNTGLMVNSIMVYADPGELSTCTPTGILDNDVVSTIVYPNPTDGPFEMQFEALSTPGKLEVHNSLGQIVFTSSVASGSANINADIDLSSGLYFLTLTSGKSIEKHTLSVK
jgi:hypothetical protein